MAIHGTLAIVIAFTLTSLSTVVVALRYVLPFPELERVTHIYDL